MAKKMRRRTTLFKHKIPSQDHHIQQPSVSQSWLPCRDLPDTLSFRATTTPDTSTLTQYIGDEEEEEEEEDIETVVIRGVTTIKSSERLFFSPEKTNSILKNTAKSAHCCRKLMPTTTSTHDQPEENHNNNNSTSSVDAPMIRTTSIESLDPYMDFRSSMEEMVEAHGLQDWDLLEELLGCYLMLNEKRNHCHIIRAFADLVILLIKSSKTNSSDLASDSFVTSFSSPLHLSSTSTTAETSCSSSSIAPAEAGSQ